MAARGAARRRVALSPADWARSKWLTIVAHVGALAPLAWLVWRWMADDLGPDPINTINNLTGRTAISLLALSLSATPIYIVTGWSKPRSVRRALGLYAFLYATLHLWNFVGLDYAWDVGLIFQDAPLQKPYIVAGLAALLLLLPLALTSTKGWMRRLGRGWTRLHRLVYIAAGLAALHFFWQAKTAERFDPLLYATILTLLLVVRIPPVRRVIIRARQRLASHSSSHS